MLWDDQSHTDSTPNIPQDNYGYILMDEATKQAAAIDPVEVGDAHGCGEEGVTHMDASGLLPLGWALTCRGGQAQIPSSI